MIKNRIKPYRRTKLTNKISTDVSKLAEELNKAENKICEKIKKRHGEYSTVYLVHRKDSDTLGPIYDLVQAIKAVALTAPKSRSREVKILCNTAKGLIPSYARKTMAASR